jgi:hypothetical protein
VDADVAPDAFIVAVANHVPDTFVHVIPSTVKFVYGDCNAHPFVIIVYSVADKLVVA